MDLYIELDSTDIGKGLAPLSAQWDPELYNAPVPDRNTGVGYSAAPFSHHTTVPAGGLTAPHSLGYPSAAHSPIRHR